MPRITDCENKFSARRSEDLIKASDEDVKEFVRKASIEIEERLLQELARAKAQGADQCFVGLTFAAEVRIHQTF